MKNLNMRYAVSILAGTLLVTTFQNCGQPGSIATNSSVLEGATSTGGGDPTTVPPVSSPQYRDLEKDVSVTQSAGKVDVLVVIDNSGSMAYEQQNMSSRFSSFLGRLQGLDWQVGIVTTDITTDTTNLNAIDGMLLHFDDMNSYLINSSQDFAAAQSAFSKVIQRPANEGSGNEQGVKATYRALQRAVTVGDHNVGLLRDGAALSVILVSDSDETVAGNDHTGDVSTFTELNKAVNLYNYVHTTYPDKNFKFNSIIVRDGDLACLNFKNSYNEAYGENYQTLTGMTSGILGSVCETDYGDQLSAIGDSTVELVKVVTLDCAPVDSNGDGVLDLVVTDANGNIVSGYTVNSNTVTFAQQLPVGSYKFKYRCSAVN
jgi:hypothetical protein